MPGYLMTVKLTPQGLAARTSGGFAAWAALNPRTIESVGGMVECTYFTPSSSEWDFVAIVNLPTSDAAFAIANRLMAGGAAQACGTTELRTAEEADAAAAIQVDYTPPGQT